MIIDELVECALSKAERQKIADVRAGLGYTCVMLENSNCGLAYTFRNHLGQCCDVLHGAGDLIGKDCAELIPWIKDCSRLKAAIGLAAANAAVNNGQDKLDLGNLMDVLTVKPTEHFGMIGEFKPILYKVSQMTKNIHVFDEHDTACGEIYSENAISNSLPKCDVIIVTATSIINHTIDKVLMYCQNAREVCIVGPSTPLCPEIFGKYHVTLLAGTVVKNPELILQIVSQAGGTMSMKPAVKQVLMRV